MSGMLTLRAATLVAALGVVVLGGSMPADATTIARAASAVHQVGSGTWSVVPTTASTSPYGMGALSLNFPKVTNAIAPPQYFNLANSGNLTVTGAAYTVTGLDTTQVTVETCIGGTWNETAGTCSGTIVTLVTTATGTTSGTASSSTVPATAGSLLRARVKPLAISKNSTDMYTVSVAVTRSQIRASTSTTS